MDPVICLFPEILDRVWCLLPVRDLLATRLVSTVWHDSVTASSAAWRCKMKGELGDDWKGFYEGMKVRRRWERTGANGFPRSKDLGPIKLWAANDKAVYFTTPDDHLIMSDPWGRIVRTLPRLRILNMYSGWTGLVLESTHGAIFGTDLVMNATGDIGVGRVEAVSEKMVVFSERRQNEVTVVTDRTRDKVIFKEINQLVQCEALVTTVVFAHGFPARNVTIFDADTRQMIQLKTFRASPMCIPRVTLVPGPGDHFCVLADINSDWYPFNRVNVYRGDRLSHEETLENLHSVVFTSDYFVSLTDSLIVIYSLMDWTRHQVVETVNLRRMGLASFDRTFNDGTPCRNWFVIRSGEKARVYDASLCRYLSEIDLRGEFIKFFYEWIVVDYLAYLGVKNIKNEA